jgi:hypothetical protein
MRYKKMRFRIGQAPLLVGFGEAEAMKSQGWELGVVKGQGMCLVRPEEEAARLEYNRPIVTPQVPTAAGR